MRRLLEEQRQILLSLAHVWYAIALSPADHPAAEYVLRVGWTKRRSTRLDER